MNGGGEWAGSWWRLAGGSSPCFCGINCQLERSRAHAVPPMYNPVAPKRDRCTHPHITLIHPCAPLGCLPLCTGQQLYARWVTEQGGECCLSQGLNATEQKALTRWVRLDGWMAEWPGWGWRVHPLLAG